MKRTPALVLAASMLAAALPASAADAPQSLPLPGGGSLPLPPGAISACRGENVGRVVGGLLGAAIGREIAGDRRTLGTVGGALAGAWLGGTIGRQVDAGQPGCGTPRAPETAPGEPASPGMAPPSTPRST
jgi:hypothetical protein